MDDVCWFLQCFRQLFMKNILHLHPYKYCLQRILCSDFRSQLLFLFYENRPAKTQFQISPFPTATRSQKSRTPPDRSATPYYVESFRFQPGFIERKFKILKVFSKTLTWNQFSGLTAANKNNALLILWKPIIVKHVKVKMTRSEIPYKKTCLTTPHHFSRPLLMKQRWNS